jgi:hypothetical protein|tara:strand:- start:3 stop:179 length:177 start_codon:yes stop_codon:yes gene_type:complete
VTRELKKGMNPVLIDFIDILTVLIPIKSKKVKIITEKINSGRIHEKGKCSRVTKGKFV